ncbi:fungal-specific transcription factor domain-containing protein [Podospora conica]|nr:fungal-specific transcription factor domain-containing protein [Schizothecium conicum]
MGLQDASDLSSSAAARAQCWECRRRRLVCDGDKPVCNKCRTAGIVCPGYADKKPLVWVANGQVLSRPRGRKPKDKAAGKTGGPGGKQPVATGHKVGAAAKEVVRPSVSRGGGGGGGVVPGLPPHHLRRDMRLRTEECDMIEAVEYYNTRLYSEAMEDQLAPDSYVIKWPSNTANLPPSVAHLMVTTAISHRLIRLSGDIDGDQRMSLARSRLYHHRVIAIRLISELVMDEKNPASDMAIIGVWSLFFSQVQQQPFPSWRPHAEGLLRLINLRGSMTLYHRRAPHMAPGILALLCTFSLADTTSPPLDQILPLPHENYASLFAKLHAVGGNYPSLPFPTSLFLDIFHINSLRSRAAAITDPSDLVGLTVESLVLLDTIEAFAPDSTPHPPDQKDCQRATLVVLGHIFQAAVALYCILSLQSVGALPVSSDLARKRRAHAEQLLGLMEQTRTCRAARQALTWPLVVAGVELAGRSGAWEARSWVAKGLSQLGREVGTANPGTARALLERFWERGGEGGWDGCFDAPYALVL